MRIVRSTRLENRLEEIRQLEAAVSRGRRGGASFMLDRVRAKLDEEMGVVHDVLNDVPVSPRRAEKLGIEVSEY